MFYVYVLYSPSFNRLYIGYSSDLKRRFKHHNQGNSKATRPFRPYELIFYEAFLEMKDAKGREMYLKSGWGRRSLKNMLPTFYQKHPKLNKVVLITQDDNTSNLAQAGLS